MTIGERLHFYSALEQPAPAQAAAPSAPASAPPGPITGVKIHAAVWLAAALLHEAGHPEFSASRLADEVERRFGDTRSGVATHISAHCVANAPKNTTVEYSYLFRTDSGQYRLFRPGDPLHPSRTAPGQSDIPEPYWELWRKAQRPVARP